MADGDTIQDCFGAGRTTFSVEFFPPKDEAAADRMLRAAEDLRPYDPDFVSITYGAGGGTRETTMRYARALKEDLGFEVMPHLTCAGHTKEELLEILGEFRDAGFRAVMALRGDPPKGEDSFSAVEGGFSHADELVSLARAYFPEFSIGVAGYPEKHPEAPDFGSDVSHLANKVSCGADFVTTQLFFDNAKYFSFVNSCRAGGIDAPVLPGLLPVGSLSQIKRFCAMCGATLPDELTRRLEAAGDDPEAVGQVGADWAYGQLAELLDRGAPGFHVYCLNKSKVVIEALERLRADGRFRAG